MRRSLVLAACVAVASTGAARSSDAQLLKKIKERAKATVEEKVVKKTEERVMQASGEVVDSVAEKSSRKADSAVTKSGTAINTVVGRTERVVSGVIRGGGDSELARQFATGRVVLTEVRFTAADAVDPSSEPTIRSLAKLIADAQGPYVVEGHAVDRAAGERRAKAVKARLVAAGVDASRLFALGQTAADPSAEHVELARMQ